jgi:alpha-galactosidase
VLLEENGQRHFTKNQFTAIRGRRLRHVLAVVCWTIAICFLSSCSLAAANELSNAALIVRIGSADGSYTIAAKGSTAPILRARVAVQVDHHWINSSDYPEHDVAESDFQDSIGRGRQATVTSKGLRERPELIYTMRLYVNHPFGDIEVQVRNQSSQALQIQSIRSVEAVGEPILNLHASPALDRVLSDSYSEDWPPLRIYDLGKAPNGLHRAVGSQLICNQQSKESVFFGALTSEKFLTILRLNTKAVANSPSIVNFTVDSTGTTEIQATEEESGLHDAPKENLIELSLPLAAGTSMASERLMFAAGSDYHAQLENYGAAIRELHHSRIAEDNLLGWWSWTAFYMKITEGNTFTNALWLAEHLKPLGYDLFHFDFGYSFARGDYAVTNASKFPHGMSSLTHRVCELGLRVGVWTAPFEVGERSSIYEQHKDWLVHNARGVPIQITTDEEIPTERVFVLDATNPGAQEFLRQTYRTLAREWEAKYIKLDFMDNTAIEGYYFRPNTTALEAQRVGLQVIRDAVGDGVLLDKDGSPMLNPVGLVDEGRVSQDTGHTFERSKEAAPGIAARYYMNRNFFVNDPDAFTVSRQLLEEREIQAPLTLNEAQVSIALSAVSGGMYEVGDDLPTLGVDADRVALLKNTDLLAMAKLSRAAIPLDLLSYRAEDEQPSVFLLRESGRQAMLAVFNWTDQPRSHQFSLAELNLKPGNAYELHDVFAPERKPGFERDSIEVEQPAHSVRMIKIVDTSLPAGAPLVSLRVPERGRVGEDLQFASVAEPSGVPALAYHWDFGDGTTEDTRHVEHAYTMAGSYQVRLTVDGLDGVSAEKKTSISVNGNLAIPPPSRYKEE